MKERLKGESMKKIQKLIIRFKNWLIVKLGGYTLPSAEFKVYRPKPIELHATLKCAKLGYVSEEQIKEQLVQMIAEEIKNKKLYDLKFSFDIEAESYIYRMEVLAVEPFNVQ